MKKTSTKLFLAAAALGLAATSTIGSTYAWFTVNGSAQASGLSMEVSGGYGIMLRKHTAENDGQFTDVLDLKEDFKDKTWSACTPKDTATLSSFQILDLSKTLSSDILVNKDNTYVYKDVESDKIDTYVYTLDLDVRVTENYNFYIYVSDVVDTSTKTCKAKNVVRVGVINYDNLSNPSASIYGISDRGDDDAFRREDDYALDNFNAVFAKNLNPISHTKPISIAKTETNNGCRVEVDNTTITKGYATERVTLKVWYDGNDKQCSDDILSSKVDFKLNFVPIAK